MWEHLNSGSWERYRLGKSIRFKLKQGVEQFTLRSKNLLILFGIMKNFLRSGKSQTLYLFIRRVIKQTVVNIQAYHLCQQHTKFYPTSCCQGQFHMQRKLLGIINVEFDTTGKLLIINSAFVKYLRKHRNTMKQCFSYLQASRKPMIQLGGSCIILSLSLIFPWNW